MWILFVVVIIVVIVFLIGQNLIKSFLNQKVAAKGGMLVLYKVLIDGMLYDDNARIIKVSDNRVNLGVININGSTILTITQLVDKVLVVWKLSSNSFGKHILRWEFPERLNQNEMLKTINTHVTNYLQNLPNGPSINNMEASEKDIQVDHRTISLKKLALTFNCNLNEVQGEYIKELNDSQPTKNELDHLLNQYSKSFFEEAIENNTSPKNTISGIVYGWTMEYSRKNKLNGTKLDINFISEIYDSSPILIYELMDAINNNESEKFNNLLSNHPEFLNLFNSKSPDLTEEKISNYDFPLYN